MNIRPAGKDILKAGNKTNCTIWSELAWYITLAWSYLAPCQTTMVVF